MSNTRFAKEGSPLRQERWASSPDLHRGLLAHLVARRCTLLEDAELREIIWWVHLLSHRPGAWSEHTGCDEGALAPFCLAPTLENFEEQSGYAFEQILRKLRQAFFSYVRKQREHIVVTAIGRQICDTLDFTLEAGCMTLIEGEARTGKTYAARAWCEQHPGRARFIEVPSGNDDVGLFRALSRGLGMSVSLNWKLHELKERVEEVLLSGQLLLCLDEAHRLWPQTNAFRGYPSRINWLMSMVNQSVPVCLIATPQFLQVQKLIERMTGWNGAQLTGRISHYVRLPGELSDLDLLAVGRALLPGIATDCLKHVVTYARISSKYLAAVEHVARRAHYLAGRAGRSTVEVDDVRSAMKDAVIPSDTAIVASLSEAGGRHQRAHRTIPDLKTFHAPPAGGEVGAGTPQAVRGVSLLTA